MARKLAASDVHRIAKLARLELTTAEVDLFARQLGAILDYADDVQRVDTTGVLPTSHPLGDTPRWRDDEPRPSLDREAVLEHAPAASQRAGLFKVPKVL
ncbi:MAG: Asp-tRNA(Asn)/Glu-tRNA(Gln) amidotransferase subunit GatC [Vicinamibacterales bacterium]